MKYRLTITVLFAALAASAAALPAIAPEEAEPGDEVAPEIRAARSELGELLFREQLFTNPASDFQASCASCHQTGGTQEGRGPRAWADYTPFSMTAQRGTTTRNASTISGPWKAGTSLGWAGSWTSMEELVRDKLLGPINGWKASDHERALSSIHFTLVEEGSGGGSGPGYVERFETAWDTDITKLSVRDTVDTAIRALADYAAQIQSSHTSRWDAFATQNRIRPGPNAGESPDNYAFWIESRIGNQEGRRLVRRPEGMSREAYEGFKLFFRVFGEDDQSVGNCVACHVPPSLSDGKFHNIGAAALQYERANGAGSWSRFVVPNEPAALTAVPPEADNPAAADLGYWNHAPAAERAQHLGAFKTPGLRNLGGTDPYFHDGSQAALEDVIRQKMELAKRAQDGKLAGIDPEILEIRLSEQDIAPLAAFLRTLDDVGAENFRHFLINFEND